MAAEPTHGNVVLIMLDDAGREAIGASGGTSIATPHIDALAAQGATFTNAFATPVCTPSRVQLLTGTYPFHNGIHKNLFKFPLDEQVKTTYDTFGRRHDPSGYRTTVAGKWQLCRFLITNAPNTPKNGVLNNHCYGHGG